MISFRQRGDFSKFSRYLKNVQKAAKVDILGKYGRAGVAALSSATPVDSGLTAESWYYKVERSNQSAKIIFLNSNVNDGVQIAVILQYGHGTGSGGWVEGRDYINPAIQPIFEKLADEAWKEVVNA